MNIAAALQALSCSCHSEWMPPCRWTSSSTTCRTRRGCALIYMMVSYDTYAMDPVDPVLQSRHTACLLSPLAYSRRGSRVACRVRPVHPRQVTTADEGQLPRGRCNHRSGHFPATAPTASLALRSYTMHIGQPCVRHLPYRHSAGDGAHDRPPTCRAAWVAGAGLRATELGRRSSS
jgi:hypothetical protein